jgi:predicted nucleotidyltransferase
VEERHNLQDKNSNVQDTRQWIPRDGDALLSLDGFVFYALGYLHPPNRVISYLKYVPKDYADEFDLKWLPYEWELRGVKLVRPAKLYSPENYENIIQVFNKKHPGYLIYDPNLKKKIIAIPRNSVKSVFEPRVSLAILLENENKRPLDALEIDALRFIKSMSKLTRVAISDLGIHGSISLRMHNTQSDIDIAVYGATNFSKVLAHAYQMSKKGVDFTLLEETMFDTLRKNRFLWHDRRVVLNAIRRYDEIKEHFGDFTYQATGRHVSSKCVVTDDWESVFRPAVYGVSQHKLLTEDSMGEGELKPNQVVSMIGEFRGVASKGEEVKVSGSLEKVIEARTQKVHHYRIVVGSGEQKPQDEFIWPTSRIMP